MLQLIKKDFTIHKIMWFFAVLVMGAYVLSESSTLLIGIIFCLSMTMHMFASDEKKSAHLLLNSLPFTRKDIVVSKYVSAVLYTVLIITIIVAFELAFNNALPNGYHLLMIGIFSLLSVAFLYPFSYRFHSKYFLFVIIGIFAAYFLSIKLFVPDLNDQIRKFVFKLSTVDQPIVYLYVSIATIILYGISGLLSIRIYSKKVFE